MTAAGTGAVPDVGAAGAGAAVSSGSEGVCTSTGAAPAAEQLPQPADYHLTPLPGQERAQ